MIRLVNENVIITQSQIKCWGCHSYVPKKTVVFLIFFVSKKSISVKY